MKTALAIALVALSACSAWAQEPAAQAPAAPTEAAPQTKAEPEAVPEMPLVLAATPGNFCGQARVLDLMLKTEIGQQLQREQQAEVERALGPQQLEAEKVEKQAMPAEQAEAQALEALLIVDMPRDIGGKRLSTAWSLSTEVGTQLHRSYMAALVETAGQAKLPAAFQPRRKSVYEMSEQSKMWSLIERRRELEAQEWIFSAQFVTPRPK